MPYAMHHRSGFGNLLLSITASGSLLLSSRYIPSYLLLLKSRGRIVMLEAIVLIVISPFRGKIYLHQMCDSRDGHILNLS